MPTLPQPTPTPPADEPAAVSPAAEAPSLEPLSVEGPSAEPLADEVLSLLAHADDGTIAPAGAAIAAALVGAGARAAAVARDPRDGPGSPAASDAASADPVHETAATLAAANPATDRAGERLGPWRIVRLLGAGGMGNVYEARRDDGQFDARVAVKVLRSGLDSATVLARFAHERRALARLDHPHIAKLLDAGVTADGLPYFVMARIDGRPIDAAARDQPIAVRLGWFLQLAEAVSHAHRNLLVHRDLKPGNVLVDAHGNVQLLDFGIAQALEPADGASPAAADASGDDAPDLTRDGPRPFTPRHASPEQVRGEPATTATDVHALGVLLYQLLTGLPPYGRGATTPAAAARAVLEEQPARPSALTGQAGVDPTWVAHRRRLRGALDAVLLKALAKDPADRYPTVDAFAADVRAWMEDRPVTARPATAGYRMTCFVRRHRFGVAAGTALAVAVLAGLGTTAWQAREAMRARDAAEARLAQFKGLTRETVFRYGDATTYLPGGLPLKERLMLDALRRLEAFAELVQDDTDLRADVATAYARLADLGANETTASLDRPEQALQHAERAIALGLPLLATHGGDVSFVAWLARAQGAQGHALRQAGRASEALHAFERARDTLDGGLRRNPRARTLVMERAVVLHAMGQLLYQPGNHHLDKPDDALRALDEARGALEQLVAADAAAGGDATAVEAEAAARVAAAAPGDAAADALVDAAEDAVQHAGPSSVLHHLGSVVGAIHLVHQGRHEVGPALENGRRALALRRQAADAQPGNVIYLDGLMTEANNLGFFLLRLMRPAEALDATSLARETGQLLARQNGPSSRWVRMTRLYGLSHGRALAGVGRHAEALPVLEEAAAELVRMQAEQPSLRIAMRQAYVEVQCARSLAALGRVEEARGRVQAAADAFAKWRDDPAAAEFRHGVLVDQAEALAVLAAATPAGEAREALRRTARETYAEADALKPLVGDVAVAYLSLGQPAAPAAAPPALPAKAGSPPAPGKAPAKPGTRAQ